MSTETSTRAKNCCSRRQPAADTRFTTFYNDWEPYGDVTLYTDRPESLEEQINRAKDADIIMNTRGIVTWYAEALRQVPKLRLIATCSIGTDNIDLDTARELGIVICNQPGRTAPVVAEHGFGLMFAAAKRSAFMTAAVKSGGWPRWTTSTCRAKRWALSVRGTSGRRWQDSAAPSG